MTAFCLLILLLGQFRGWIRRSAVKVCPIDVKSEGDVEGNYRRDRRVNVTGNGRELQISVKQDVLGGEERGHRQQDNQDAIEENYTEVAVLVALFLRGEQNKTSQRNTRLCANNPKKKKPTADGGQVVPTINSGEGESSYSHFC